MQLHASWSLVAVCAATLGICGCSAKTDNARPNPADARLQAIYSDEWKWREQQFPDSEDAGKKIADHLPKVDPASQELRLKMWRGGPAKLDGIPPPRTPPPQPPA